jgi:hypothetical protein
MQDCFDNIYNDLLTKHTKLRDECAEATKTSLFRKERIEQLTAELDKYKARYADELNKRLDLAEKVAKIERNCMQGVTLELTKEHVDSMCDFLEAEFIEGVGGDARLDGNEHVESIRTVYNMLQEVSKNEG